MTFEEFLGHVQRRARLGSKGDALTATRATLETLAERLFHGEKDKLAAQLPLEIGEFLRHTTKSEKYDIDELFQRVSQRARVDLPLAVHHARVVAEVLREAVGEGAFGKLRVQLPPEFHPLFEGSAGKYSAPEPGRIMERPAEAAAQGGSVQQQQQQQQQGASAATHKRARDIMTPSPEPIRASATVCEAARKMRDLDVGSLPVLDDQGQFAGMVTDRDITVRVTARGEDPNRATVEAAMTRDIVCCEEDAELEQVARVMQERQVRRIPIVKKGESTEHPREIVGIISLGDLATDLRVDEVPARTLAEVSEDR